MLQFCTVPRLAAHAIKSLNLFPTVDWSAHTVTNLFPNIERCLALSEYPSHYWIQKLLYSAQIAKDRFSVVGKGISRLAGAAMVWRLYWGVLNQISNTDAELTIVE